VLSLRASTKNRRLKLKLDTLGIVTDVLFMIFGT